jgi:hypothetical protein
VCCERRKRKEMEMELIAKGRGCEAGESKRLEIELVSIDSGGCFVVRMEEGEKRKIEM